MNKSILMIAASSLVLGGCTTSLNVHKLDPGQQTNRVGPAYFLPFNQFDVNITWTAKCEDNGQFKIAVNTTAKKLAKKDPTVAYVIDYTSLDAALKTSSISAEFYEDTGLLKSINASATDETASTITTVAAALGKATLLGVGSLDGTVTEKCSDALIANLALVKTATGELKTASDALQTANDALKKLQAQIIKAGGVIDPNTQADLNGRIGDVRAAMVDQSIKSTALERAKAKVSHSVKTKFPKDGNQVLSEKVFKAKSSSLTKWVESRNPDGTYSAISSARAKTLSDGLAVRLKLDSEWFGATDDDGNRAVFSDPGDPELGIRYRLAVPATLITCVGSIDVRTTDCPTDKVEVKPLSVEVMQGGTTRFLPFKSESFSNAKLTATFSKTGVLTSVGYTESKAAATSIAETAGSVFDTILGIGPAKRARRLAKFSDEAKLITAENDLEALIAAQSAADTDAVSEEAAEALEAEAEAAAVEIEANIVLRAVADLQSGDDS